MNKPITLLIDGNSLAYRAFYATFYSGYAMRGANGTPTNAVNSVGNMIINLLVSRKPTYVLVAFDHGKRTKRHDDFAEYKAGRKPMPHELVVQMPMIRELMTLMGLATLSLDGIEADDIVATVAKTFSRHDYPVEILSSDNDLLQLVDKNITVLQPIKGTGKMREVNFNNFRQQFLDIAPEQVPDLKGIMGDASDNIQGIKGIGEKGAISLLQKYGSLEQVLASVAELSPATSKKVEEGRLSAELSKKLATVQTDVPIDLSLEDMRLQKTDKEALLAYLDNYQLMFLKRKVVELFTLTGDHQT